MVYFNGSLETLVYQGPGTCRRGEAIHLYKVYPVSTVEDRLDART